MWPCASVVNCFQDLSIVCSISVPSDKRDLQNKTAEQNCLQHLRVSATTRFPLFQAFTFNPAVGKAAQWIRSEILMNFVFFTSLIGLPRAEKNGF